MKYTGTLLDGKEFDSGTLTFNLGRGKVIKCWDQGAAQLVKGQKAKFVCPSYLAYGERGMGEDIGPNATLLFEVEVLEIAMSVYAELYLEE